MRAAVHSLTHSSLNFVLEGPELEDFPIGGCNGWKTSASKIKMLHGLQVKSKPLYSHSLTFPPFSAVVRRYSFDFVLVLTMPILLSAYDGMLLVVGPNITKLPMNEASAVENEKQSEVHYFGGQTTLKKNQKRYTVSSCTA